MPTTYCPQTGCGAEIHYTGAKPKSCPKCRRDFAAAFARAAKVEEEPESRPSPRRAALVTPKKSPLLKRDRPSRFAESRDTVAASSFMNQGDLPPELRAPEPDELSEDDLDEITASADPSEVSALAAELMGTIDENDIIVDLGEEPIRFQGCYDARGGNASPGPRARKPRRSKG